MNTSVQASYAVTPTAGDELKLFSGGRRHPHLKPRF
jgi:hypothetical protein